jgi:peptidoglycan/xylan/chitin deacetylase (PgdA/CDA1 family)
MFVTEPITGADLPDGHLVLTYDDGPGPNTLAVAEYLSEMGIEATFFVVGESIERLPEVPAQVRALGHRLGNHTWTHYYEGLPKQLLDRGAAEIVDELLRTAALLSGEEALAFRPPYGAWDPRVAATLNADDILSPAHVGPFNWAIHHPDWAAWRDGVDPTIVATRFRVEANAKRKGIVLLHDYTAEAHRRPEPEFRLMAERNRSVELTRALVPMLLADGFRFVPLGAAISETRTDRPPPRS